MARAGERTEAERTIVSSWIPLAVAHELQDRAARADRSVSAEIRRAIKAHLDRSRVRS